MSESAFSLYYNQRIKQVFNHLLEFDLSSSENSLHDFRVEIKKLKAILKFLKSVYPKQKLKKTARNLNHIFQQAGEIREYQLLLQWFQKHDLEIFIEKLFPAEILEKLVAKFHQQAHNFKTDLKDLNDQVIEYVVVTNEIVSEQYITDLTVQMDSFIRKNCPISEWHELRKIIKQWMYAINWVGDHQDRDISFYQKLQETIGYWHDAQVVKETLLQKKIFLSHDVELQKSFTIANEKLNQSLRYREKQIHELLNRKEMMAL
jgi:CHAD domain-containing protein